MRRGHPGIGGWRNENPRHFRPRNGGNPHFRPSRPYGLLDQHRFPPPGPRPHRPLQTFKRRGNDDHPRHDSHDRGKYRPDYRQNNHPRNHEENHPPQEKQLYPIFRHYRSSEAPFKNPYPKDPPNYYEGSSKHCHMNNMGDIDHRYMPPRETFRQPVISNTWAADNNVNQYDDRTHKNDNNKTHRYDASESSKLPSYEYKGHRPPSSDHYGGNPTPVINNSESFNRSVDDTVNIIRKRLLNRNDPQSEASDTHFADNPVENQTEEKSKESNQNFIQEQPTKKKAHKQKPPDKLRSDTSFTKIKSKIVNQLFKMDKEKIHKLMDNPNSSSKFEYAISSLITESQYSFNRHLRSVAEKSLHTSSSIDFIQDDNNTIYEDTFMKQMQLILDPQDTVLLEDIKPLVMAELSKALQLDEYEQRFEVGEDEANYPQKYEQQNYSSEYYDNLYNYEDYSQQTDNSNRIPSVTAQESSDVVDYGKDNERNYENNEPIFESQSRRRSCNLSPVTEDSVENQSYPPRLSLDERLNKMQFGNTHSEPENPMFDTQPECRQLFTPNAEAPLDDDDDPFAELDNQYHVAVDHSFIDNDDSSSLHLDRENQEKSPTIPLNINTPEKEFQHIKKEIDHQLQDMALSPLKFSSHINNLSKTDEGEIYKNLLPVKQETKSVNNDNQLSHSIRTTHVEKPNSDEEPKSKVIVKSDTSHIINKNSGTSITRKRSIDQSPSHRKEKRKKSNSFHHDSDKQSTDKNLVLNANDTSSNSKALKKDDKKSFPEKHTKRKESHKKTEQKDNEPRKKLNSTENLNASLSPKESSNIINSNKNSKSETKPTLKTFDIFTEQPKKVTNIHHAHRNTALAPVSNVKNISQPNTKQENKITKKHVAVQVMKKVVSKETQTIERRSTCTRFSQTDRRKQVAKATQTDILPSIRRDSFRSADTLERMKEIDLEIQVLLQEKFKLYSSIESKESGTNSLHTLGMTVLNVSPFEEGKEQPSEMTPSEDSIVDDFTSIPVEELEQIAFESVEVEADEIDCPRPETRNRRQRMLEKEKSKSQSPIPSTPKRNNRRVKTPNISLIEQIISDDRPIEDIICLDELEETPSKTRGKNIKSKRKPKRKGALRTKAPAPSSESSDYTLKQCTVLVVREDFSKYLPNNEEVRLEESSMNAEGIIVQQNHSPEEPIGNDIHFDMLDVSEDIVIGDNCEVKSIEDKEESVVVDVPISEDIILDNSQSSIEDQQGTSSDLKENECKMFDYSADENLRRDSIVVTGNADAVLAIECIENNFIAACLDGNVYYFSGDGQLITTLRGSNLAVTCLTIVKEKYGTTVYTGSLDSRIRYYDLETGLEKGLECNVLSPIQTMDRAWDTIFVGTRTGFVLQFECKNNMLIPVSTVQFSEQSILALRAMKEGPRKVLLVAARSEDVTIKDAQTGLLLRTLVGPKMTVYTLLYEDGKVYCGTSSSQIHVFDYSSGAHVGAHEGGKGAVCLRAAGGLVFAGCYDGCVYVYREGERRPFAQLRGPGLMLLSLAVRGTKIIAGYKDRSLYIWKIPLNILQEMIL
ncbi:uncharacterized protein [Epargyreus clarus]|uniref:uncharacterized protein n=1 Tax=Epargyreus clarus TaxID=520877 RepID=UPI003C2AF54E